MKLPDVIILPPNRVWRSYLGGKIIDNIQGKTEAKDSHFPEDWIASTTVASNGEMEQRDNEGLSEVQIHGRWVTLKSLMEEYPAGILGLEHYQKYGANTQFLLKFLDSSIRLHVQAHPTIPFAKKYLNSNSGKTEAYVILGVRDEIKDPYIYLGFQKRMTPDVFKKIIEEQDIARLLTYFEKIPIKPGDIFIVPGGLTHAIGEGVFMIEIMEPTDFVVRVEYKRGGYLLPHEARFMGRDVDFAINMIDFKKYGIDQIKQNYFCQPKLVKANLGGTEYSLIDRKKTKCFTINKLIIKDTFMKKSDTFYVGVVTKGGGQIISDVSQVNIKMGDKFLVGYKTKDVMFISNNGMEIILAFPLTI